MKKAKQRQADGPVGTTPKLVIVEWHDSMSYATPWKTVAPLAEGLRKHGQDIIREVGFLIDETDDYLLLCAGLDYEPDEDMTISRVYQASVIPKGCIIRVHPIADRWLKAHPIPQPAARH